MRRQLEWTGSLSVNTVSDLRSELQNAVDESTEIEVDLSACSAIDLSVLQLLCSGQRLARSEGKRILLHGFDCAAVNSATIENGFFRAAPCCTECGSFCLWLKAAPVA